MIPARPWRRRSKARLLAAGASAAHAVLGPLENDAVGILMYHRVAEPVRGLAPPKYNVPPRRFETQLRGLLASGFQAWPLQTVLEHHRARRPIPPRTFVVTFDDGFDNVYAHAWPVLARLRVPATVFLATAYLDSPYAFPMDDWELAGSDRVPAVSWRPLSTTHCRTMQASGLVELGAHTHTHQDFRDRPRAFGEDLKTCLAELRRRFGVETATFAFPFGEKELGFASAELAAVAERTGVLCALTTESKLMRPGADCFDLGRVMPEDFDSNASLAAKLSGWHDRLRGLGRAVLRRARHPLAAPAAG